MTIMRFFFKHKPLVEYNREKVTLPDGGECSIDWPCIEPENMTEDMPICILIPGVAGHSQESYLLQWILELRSLGIRSVVFLNRGAGGQVLQTAISYDGLHNVKDLRQIILSIHDKYPNAPLVCGGTSMGGVTLVHYLSSYGNDSLIAAAMIQSAGWCIFESVKSLSKPSNMIFNLYLTMRYKEVIKNNKELFESDRKDMDIKGILKCTTVQEIHTKFVVPNYGYKNVEEYWAKLSPHRQLLNVKIPLLSLNAADDVFSPEHSIPVHLTETNPNIAFVVTAKGGHIGFMEGMNPKQMGYNDCVFFEFIQTIRTAIESGQLNNRGEWVDGLHSESEGSLGSSSGVRNRQYPTWPKGN